MAKNDFRVTSTFKIIIRICMNNAEFCIFYLTEKELNQQVCLMKYVEYEISNSNSHQKKKKKRTKNIIQLQKHF